MMYIPESILRCLPEEMQRLDEVGRSGASVWQYADRVLKVQTDSPLAEWEHTMLRWLQGRLPVPRLIAEDCTGGKRFLLMSRMPGRYLCDESILDDQERLAEWMAQALRTLWAVDTAGCPHDLSLDSKFVWLEKELRAGHVTTEGAAPGTYGSGGFRDPVALFDWLVAHRPATEDLVLSHGDCCLPNIFVDDVGRVGFIDVGMAGIADRWLDIEKALWSMWANTTGQFGGKARPFNRQLLFDALGMAPDEEKLRYYGLLDNLF